MIIYIDGILLQNPTDSLNEPKITLRRRNENGEFAISFSGELNFIGADYDYIYNKLVVVPNAINNSIILKFVDDCCPSTEFPAGKEYIFLIKPESLKWCDGNCELQANAVEYSPDSQAYTCFENTLIWDDYAGFKSALHPRMKYCLEFRPSLLQDMFLILGLFTVFGATTILAMFATILLPLIGLINAIVTFINGAFSTSFNTITIGGFDDPIDIFNYVKDLFETTNGQLIAGCGYEHPSPLVRSYIDNVCTKCGVAWTSSVLKEANPSMPNFDYYLLVYLSAPIKGGRLNNPYFVKPIVPFIEDNEPIHNLKSFLDEVAKPFNAAWDISSGTMRFERRDFFQTQIPFLDLTTYDPEKIISQCYEWSKKRRPAYANIGYQKDAVNWVGSEAQARWSDIIEWNVPVNPIQKGEFTQIFPYSPARFREDGIERDVLSDYDWMPYGIGQNIKDGEKYMLMNNGTSFVPQLLIWDGANVLDGTVRRSYSPPGIASGEAVNYPMWVDADRPGNLYDRFWAIENPKLATFSGYDFTARITWDCLTLNAIDINGTIMTSKGLSKTIESIELDFTTSIMTIKGTV